MLENGDLVLHFWDSDMGPELETKSHVFTAWKQGTVLWGPKTSCRRCFGDSKNEAPRHVSEARPKTQCWVFSDWNGGSVPCWWGSESGSTPHFGDWAMVTGSAAVGLSPAPVSRPLVCCLLQAYLVEQNKGLTAGCWGLEAWRGSRSFRDLSC